MSQNEYIASFADNPERVFEDVQEIVSATEKQEFAGYFIPILKELLENMDFGNTSLDESERIDVLLMMAMQPANKEEKFSIHKTWAYSFFQSFFFTRIFTQISVMRYYHINPTKSHQIIRQKVSEWYEALENKEEKKAISVIVPAFNEKYMWMAYNKAAVAMATMDSKG